MSADRALTLRESVITFVLITALTVAGAVGILVLLDPRAQIYWGAQFSALGSSVRAFVEGLPLPGR